MKVAYLSLFLPLCHAQTPNYKASYVGRFANFLDVVSCESPLPIVHVACQGDIAVTSTSHPTITCEQTSGKDENGWNVIRCTNTCQGSVCLEAWMVDLDATGIIHDEDEASFGEVFFECSGDDIANVDAYTSIEENGEGNCTRPRDTNVRMARLGVKCGNEYDFDDYFFECASDGLAFNTGVLKFGDDTQTCIDFFQCPSNLLPNQECSGTFGRIEVKADHENFQQTCVETRTGGPAVPEVSSPNVDVKFDFDLRATFRAGWIGGRFAPGDAECHMGQTQKVQLECIDGTIEYVGKDKSSIDCEVADSSSMVCSGQGPFDFSEALFSCTRSGSVPEATVTYLSAALECSGGTQPSKFFHAVQLGIECGSIVNYSDDYVECGARSHQFAKLNDYFELNGPVRWTCAEVVEFSAAEGLAERVFPDVSIVTDYLWLTSAPDSCLVQINTDDVELSSGAIAGIVIGSVGIAFLAVVLFVRRKKRGDDTAKPHDVTASEDTDSHENEMELSVRKSVPA